MAVRLVILLLTYLAASADSAVLIAGTINSGGDEGPKGRPFVIVWGGVLALVVGARWLSQAWAPLQSAMVIGALPFSVVMALMGVALIKGGGIRDSRRETLGVQSAHGEE